MSFPTSSLASFMSPNVTGQVQTGIPIIDSGSTDKIHLTAHDFNSATPRSS
jgi:hypothetical protein